jgi:hypothetical protein
LIQAKLRTPELPSDRECCPADGLEVCDMSLTTTQPTELLHYVSPHRVLICKECRYAIQPSAISRHLKELHKIYRAKRQEFIQYALSLDLPDPKDVVLPEPDEPPVPFLTTTTGLACGASGCSHLCVTTKRMKWHWATVHKGLPAHASQWRSVDLQTFFRGNQLRYFIVRRDSPVTSESEQHSSSLNSTAPSPEIDTAEVSLKAGCQYLGDDVQLWENFKNFTCLDLGHSSESRLLWQTEAPLLAERHSFLKHGILGLSALHLASKNPSERTKYQLKAAYHQNVALPQFRAAIANPTEDNCNALLAFTQLLILHCFAAGEQDNDLLLVRGKESGLPDWLHVTRGSCTIFRSVWHFVRHGPFIKLLIAEEQKWQLDPVPENPEISRRLTRLLAPLLTASKDLLAQKGPDAPTLSSLPAALLELSRAFSKAEGVSTNSVSTLWTTVHLWPVRVSEDYIDLLRDRNPGALILLAHYCILLRRLDSQWYSFKYSQRLLLRIYSQLDLEWRQWLDWPMEEVGLKGDSVV